MRAAYCQARQALPDYFSHFSRKDFTLPQLFACLAVKEHLKLSYRGAEALLNDCPQWLADLGLSKAPDHNTLCRAAHFLMSQAKVDSLLDISTQWATHARMIKLATNPLAVDSTYYESHHVSRHYERRCRQTREWIKAKDAAKGRKTGRSQTVRSLPKLSIAICTNSHLVLSFRAGSGAGADHGELEPLVLRAWRRVRRRRLRVVADAGYDSENNHQILR